MTLLRLVGRTSLKLSMIGRGSGYCPGHGPSWRFGSPLIPVRSEVVCRSVTVSTTLVSKRDRGPVFLTAKYANVRHYISDKWIEEGLIFAQKIGEMTEGRGQPSLRTVISSDKRSPIN